MPITVRGVSKRADNVSSVYNNTRRHGGEVFELGDAPFNQKNPKHVKELEKRKAQVDALEDGAKSKADIQAYLGNRHFSFEYMTVVGGVSAPIDAEGEAAKAEKKAADDEAKAKAKAEKKAGK